MNEFLNRPGEFETGVNYWASHAATEMWSKWDAGVVDRDFAQLAAYGMTVVRCFPLWPDFQPLKLIRTAGEPGGTPIEIRMGERPLPDTEAGRAGLDETMLERFEAFADLAQKHGLRLIVCLLTGHMTSRQFVPPAFEGVDVYTDPTALKYEVRFIRGFVNRLKHHSAIAAWESGNETNFLSRAPSADAAWSWTALIHGTIRNCDDTRPIIGISGLEITETQKHKWLIRDQAELSDLLSVHPYALWNPVYGREPFDTFRNLHHAAGTARITAGIGRKPCFVEETGTWRPMVGPYETVANALRGMLWNLYSEDCRSLLWWCGFDQDHIDVAPYDWPMMGLEHGLFAASGEPRPTADSMREFRRFLDSLPFRALPPQKNDAVCICGDMEIAFGSYLLSRQAGIRFDFQSPEQPLRDAAVYFLPSAARRAGLGTRRWHELQERVREGATLYLALDDTILDRLEPFTGCGVISRELSEGRTVCEFDGAKLDLPCPVRRRMASYGADILAREADGNPVLFEHAVGKGRVITCACPVERLVISHSGLLKQDLYRIYRRVLAPGRLATTPSPFLQITEHPLNERQTALILVNNQPEQQKTRIGIPERLHISAWYSDGSGSCAPDGTVQLQPNGGLLLLLEPR
ncbi:MAG: hypothetical protein HPZ91_11450 [Lentisphaeria bacterium]|nr:hypothetical protein [Lentisphaeria bacterium]